MRISFKSFFLPVVLGLGTVLSAGAQTLLTVAGSGPSALPNWYSGDGGPATLAQFSTPDDLAFDAAGNLYIADANNCVVRKVAAGTSLISTFAGSTTLSGGMTYGICGYSGDGGPATLAQLNYPAGLAVDAGGNLYIGDYYNNVVREISASNGAITTLVGSGSMGYSGDGGPALLAELNAPYGLAFDASGNLYIADSGNNVVRKVSAGTGLVSTVAGRGVTGFTGDGGPATLAALNAPQRLAFDPAGDLYIGDPGNFAVRKVSAGTGLISTVAGNGSGGFSGDGGPATLSTNSGPDGIAIGCGGDLFLTDDLNHRIRRVSAATGIITTVAGGAAAGYTADGPALGPSLSHPEALAFFQGNLYDVDYGNGVAQLVGGLCLPSPTPTASSTASPTPTHTPTATSTSTPTSTPTPTASSTPTATATSTPSPTPTFTATPTPSPTSSSTPTLTGTPTSSFTPSSTPTPTASSTPTASFTPSPTPTLTATSTPTPTPTWGISLAKQVIPGTAQGGTTLTYTLGVTVTGGAFTGVVVTDSLPANTAYLGLTGTNAGSAAFDPAHSLLTWSLPASLPPGAYSLTYQTQVNLLAPAGTPVINGALLGYPGLARPLSAAVTVPVTGAYVVRVGVYNEAGELVKSLEVFQSSNAVSSLALQAPQITRLTGAGSRILLYSQGILLGSWDGTNASGDPVSNGVYHIQVESVDAYGVATTVTQEAVVSRQLAQVSAAVYNEAGEVVKHLTAWVDDASGAGMTGVLLSAKTFVPGTSNPLQILIQSSGSPVTLAWDGTNDQGDTVTSGSYLLAVHWFDGQGQGDNISQSVLVAAQGARQGQDVVAEPNRLRVSNGQSRVEFLDLSGRGSTLGIRVYTLAGELIASFQGQAGTGRASWDASGSASGIYLAQVEKRNMNGGFSGRQILKIAVIR